jgi:molybdopterin-guanine dinucleotide biosynthesis protein
LAVLVYARTLESGVTRNSRVIKPSIVKIVVVGGSASNVGKTTLAARLVRQFAVRTRTVALKVSVRETPCETRVLTLRPGEEAEHRRDTGRLLAAGAECVVWVTVNRAAVRSGLALGLSTVRRLRPATVVVESTSAGIELGRISDSWFVAGEGEWKPWADRHRRRADHVVRSAELFAVPSAPVELKEYSGRERPRVAAGPSGFVRSAGRLSPHFVVGKEAR